MWSALHLENLYLKLDQDGCTSLATPSYSLQNHACIRENTHRHGSTIHNGPINDQNKKLSAQFSMQITPLPCMHRRKVSQIAHIYYIEYEIKDHRGDAGTQGITLNITIHEDKPRCSEYIPCYHIAHPFNAPFPTNPKPHSYIFTCYDMYMHGYGKIPDSETQFQQ